MSDAPDRSALIGLVDELAKQREDEARRLQEEVPVLTEVVDGKEAPRRARSRRARTRR
jgi:PII-like signaling protein